MRDWRQNQENLNALEVLGMNLIFDDVLGMESVVRGWNIIMIRNLVNGVDGNV